MGSAAVIVTRGGTVTCHKRKDNNFNNHIPEMVQNLHKRTEATYETGWVY